LFTPLGRAMAAVALIYPPSQAVRRGLKLQTSPSGGAGLKITAAFTPRRQCPRPIIQ
jgi:hypothetical protein